MKTKKLRVEAANRDKALQIALETLEKLAGFDNSPYYHLMVDSEMRQLAAGGLEQARRILRDAER